MHSRVNQNFKIFYNSVKWVFVF